MKLKNCPLTDIDFSVGFPWSVSFNLIGPNTMYYRETTFKKVILNTSLIVNQNLGILDGTIPILDIIRNHNCRTWGPMKYDPY